MLTNRLRRWRAQHRYDRALRRGDPDAIESAAERYARDCPQVQEGWWLWAEARRERAGPAAAKPILHQALISCPGSLELSYELAKTLMANGDFGGARTLLDDLVGRLPNEPAPLVGLTAYALGQKQWDEALRLAGLAASKMEGRHRGGLLRELAVLVGGIPGQRDWAIRLAVEGLRDARQDWLAHLLAAVLFEQVDESQHARYLTQARKLFPRGDDDFSLELDDLRQQVRASAP